MAHTNSPDFENWLYSLCEEEADIITNELELKNYGSPFEKATRLYRRLTGNYNADDFVQVEPEDEIATTRARRDKSLLKIIKNLDNARYNENLYYENYRREQEEPRRNA